MTIKLVTDSTCDLPTTMLQDLQVTVVPINIQFGTATYKENLTITSVDFYAKINEEGQLPKTSQPSVGDFVEVYQQLSLETDHIVSIHLTSKLSGTFQSAKLAASMVADIVKVTVIDSLAGSAGLGWMVHEAVMLIKKGYMPQEIEAILASKRSQISIYFAVDTLEYAQLSGRVGKLSSVLGTLLNIKPIIGLDNGLIDVRDKVRSKRAATDRIVELTQEKVGQQPIHLAVVHAQAVARAEQLMTMATEQFNCKASYLKDVALSLAVHFGPGTVGLVAYPVQDVDELPVPNSSSEGV
ncbi:MAG: DegV family protein [Chloroflexota bacterium]